MLGDCKNLNANRYTYTFDWNLDIFLSQGPNQIAFVYQKSCSKDIVEDVAYMKELAMVSVMLEVVPRFRLI